MITLGIDSGSLATKGVALGDNKEILGAVVDLTGGRSRQSGERVYHQVLEAAGIKESDVDFVVTTGYGRENLPFSGKNVTEITCHAAGVNFLFPDAATILDIGGQDSKVIRIDGMGRVENFIMNDKCAAGTGRFLEVIAKALEVELGDLGAISQQTDKNVEISSMCTVFAETEVVSLVADDTPVPEIVRGVHNVIVERGEILLEKIGLMPPVAMSGGVALNIGVVKELEKRLGLELQISDNPQITGALGAAVIARKLMAKR